MYRSAGTASPVAGATGVRESLGDSSFDRDGGDRGGAGDAHGVVPAMGVLIAGSALFLDVGELAAGGEFAILPKDASASERVKPE